MRVIVPVLLAIGLWGLIYPETLLDEASGGGRWVFVVILLLAGYAGWRFYRRDKK